jgi:amino-acid N-acetyltransferase
MQIVNAAPGDIDAVLSLLAECRLPDQDLTEAKMETFLLLKDGGLLIGSIGIEAFGKAALLRSLAVQEGQRGIGLGKALLAACESLATERGVGELYLLTTTAEEFFAAHGYQRIERGAAPPAIQNTGEFQTICPSSAACMRKALA